jgi:DNA replication protein DnaC
VWFLGCFTNQENASSLSFVDRRQIALFLGPPGTGKTHIAIAIGLLAIQAGKKVYCTSAKRLARDIQTHRERNALDVLFKKILGSNLWILDDWGVVSMQKEVTEEVFDLMDRRKQTTAMILTSNRDITEWDQVFPDLIIANATIDRGFDRAETLFFEGHSYRLKNRLDVSH